MNNQPVRSRSPWSLLVPAIAVFAVFMSAPLVAGGPKFGDREPSAPKFRFHAVDPTNVYSAAAAIDVNRDGKLDIVTGGVWYESPSGSAATTPGNTAPSGSAATTPENTAPSWNKRPVREVEYIRGRFDDYACLPYDVNADGHADFLVSNYRSQKIAWVEHPGAKPGPWKEHVVEKPGPMETGRLADVDGDGRLDLLPNGRDFAAWWEIVQPTAAGGEPKFVRHDLPAEIVGHGIGSGDVNGDGRADLVGPGGWLEAPSGFAATTPGNTPPADRRRDRWIWHPDFTHPAFTLGRDASMPILVTDVDADGDADLIWGRGHGTGLWWMEQSRADGKRTWSPHAIDTSWSQPHTIELADLDGDGRPELVAGKRYLGHDGNDPGEWDPLVIYQYRFSPKSRTWRRGVISPLGGPAGLDLDPKLVDLDGDGDIDLLAPGRSGLYWFENLRGEAPLAQNSEARDKPGRSEGDDAQSRSTTPDAPSYPDRTNLLVVRSSDGSERPVKTAADWGRRRAHILANVEQVMGPLPDPSKRVPLDVEIRQTQDAGKYTRLKLTFAAEPGDRVPAWLLIPHGLKGPAPAMLCLHQTTKIGKDEPAGLGGLPNLHYAHELAERGYVCIAPDYPSFGEYPYDFQSASRGYVSGSMKAIWNNLRAVDLLETRPEVDREKIGVIGHSLGGHNAIFTAAFDLRLRAVVTSCGFTAFPDYYGGKLAGWTSDRYMPRIRDVYGNDPARVPFDFPELVAAIAPRPFFTNSPLADSNFDVGGVRKVMHSAGEVYSLLGAADRLRAEYPDAGHDFPKPVRQTAYDWLADAMTGKKKSEAK